jgi:hypothetical protein
MKQDYDTEANKLAKAIDIAIDAFVKFPPKDFTKDNLDHIVNTHNQWKKAVLNPEPKFRKIASLKYSIQDVFTYFQEVSNETVEYFWQQVAKENLGYIREDKLRKILVQGKIKNRVEYDLIIDSIVAAQQMKRISSEEAKILNKMIGAFESKAKKKI